MLFGYVLILGLSTRLQSVRFPPLPGDVWVLRQSSEADRAKSTSFGHLGLPALYPKADIATAVTLGPRAGRELSTE